MDGKTEPKFTKMGDKKYTWLKAPRIDGRPMEVGALSRVLVAYVSGDPKVKSSVDGTLKALGQAGHPEVLLSVLGRIAARALEAKMICDAMVDWTGELIGNIKKGDTKYFTQKDVPEKGQGVGLWEAPRGALAHWNVIEGKKLKNYQCVVPTTWNASPRDNKGVRGPIETALIGTPVEPRQTAGGVARGPLLRPVHRLRSAHHPPGHQRSEGVPGRLTRGGGGR